MLNAPLFFRVWEVELSIQRFVIQKFQKKIKKKIIKIPVSTRVHHRILISHSHIVKMQYRYTHQKKSRKKAWKKGKIIDIITIQKNMQQVVSLYNNLTRARFCFSSSFLCTGISRCLREHFILYRRLYS